MQPQFSFSLSPHRYEALRSNLSDTFPTTTTTSLGQPQAQSQQFGSNINHIHSSYPSSHIPQEYSTAMFELPPLSRRWKWPRVLVALMLLELAGTVAGLTLFGIAQPDLFRTKLWRVGFDNGFNSSPAQILYAYANYRPIPKVPFVWSSALTDFNVVVSVLSMFILLVKVVMFVLHVWFPILATITNAIITALWIISMYGQMGPDHSDPKHPSDIAWYIDHSCEVARPSGNYHYCMLAKGTFATTVIMAAIFFLNTALGIYSLIPTAAQRAANKVEIDEMQAPGSYHDSDGEMEMTSVAKTQQIPFTPRTQALNTLNRQLPLREQSGQI